jgi:hypothetical protein
MIAASVRNSTSAATMTTRASYSYVLLRYRHDPLAGEFANVGVIVHQPSSGFLDVKIRHSLGRLSAMFPDIDGEALRSSLRVIERELKRRAEAQGREVLTSLNDAGSFGRQVLPADDSSFVWGPVGSGLTADPVKTLAGLYERFVARYDERPRSHRDDAAVWRPVRDRLAELKLADRLQPKTITSPFDRVHFDHAWRNGEWHCFQPLSFDLANEENIREKARRWAGQMVALKETPEPFKPYFFVGSPSDRALEEAYRAALKILKLSPFSPEVIEESRIEDLIRRIAIEIEQAEA